MRRLALGRLPDHQALLLGSVGALLLVVWGGANGYRLSLLNTAAMYALIALGMYIPFVMAGSLSLAYSAYAGIGGYALAIVATKTGWPLWIAWLIGPAIAAALAVVLGLATKRLSGFYLAAVTLLFANAFRVWLVDQEGLTGGSAGIGNLRKLAVAGWQPTVRQLTISGVVLVCIVAFLLDRLRLSSWGVIVRTLREVPDAVEAAGVRVPTMKLVALAVGAAVAAIGGALFTSSAGSITPDTFTTSVVFLAIFMPILGGMGTPWGAVAGAVLVVELTLNLSLFSTSGLLLVSLGALFILLLAPRGVLGYLDSVRRQLVRALSR
jgi:branched-chain amino acid transport system permease protein